MGFAPDTLDTVCVSFDKLDKIGAEGVRDELTAKELPAGAVTALYDFLQGGDFSLEAVAGRCGDPALADDLQYVLSTSEKIAAGRYGVAYCPSLVRGQGYYTGMVFEVTLPRFSGAVAGGGRYDNMVGKFIGQQVPAVASPSVLSGSAASCWSRATPFPALSPAWRCSTCRRQILPRCWPRPTACAPTTT